LHYNPVRLCVGELDELLEFHGRFRVDSSRAQSRKTSNALGAKIMVIAPVKMNLILLISLVVTLGFRMPSQVRNIQRHLWNGMPHQQLSLPGARTSSAPHRYLSLQQQQHQQQQLLLLLLLLLPQHDHHRLRLLLSADILQLEIGKVRVNTTVEEEKQKLIDMAERHKAEVEEEYQRRQQESEERVQRAMEEIDMMAAEAQLSIDQWKETTQRADADDRAFEARMRRELNEYGFFQSLYGSGAELLGKHDDKLSEDEKRIKRLMQEIQKEEQQKRAQNVQKSIDEELGSPVRAGYYGFLILTLLSVCGWEIFCSEQTSVFHVGLYGLIAVFLGLQCYKEYVHLTREEGRNEKR